MIREVSPLLATTPNRSPQLLTRGLRNMPCFRARLPEFKREELPCSDSCLPPFFSRFLGGSHLLPPPLLTTAALPNPSLSFRGQWEWSGEPFFPASLSNEYAGVAVLLFGHHLTDGSWHHTEAWVSECQSLLAGACTGQYKIPLCTTLSFRMMKQLCLFW